MLSVRDIETKTFARSKTGYKEEEVEAFLDEIIVDYTSLIEEKENLGKKVIALSEKLETIRDEQEARMQSLLSTQKSYDEVMRTAKINAESMLNDAKKKAEEILKAAKEQADQTVSEASSKGAEIEGETEAKKAEYNALADEIETLKKTVLALCNKFSTDIETLPELAKKELAAVTVPAKETESKPAEEKIPEISLTDMVREAAPETDDSVMSGETKVIPVIKETRVADVPRDVTREKINRALEIAEEEDEDMVSNDDDSDYEKEFFSRRHGNRDEDGRAAKIRNLFNSDKDDDDDEDYDKEDEFDDEYEEEPKKKKRSFFGFGKKKKSRDDDDDDFDDDYDDFDDDDDDYYDED